MFHLVKKITLKYTVIESLKQYKFNIQICNFIYVFRHLDCSYRYIFYK